MASGTITVTDTSTTISATGFDASDRVSAKVEWLSADGRVIFNVDGVGNADDNGDFNVTFSFGKTLVEQVSGKKYASARAHLASDVIDVTT